MNHLFSYSQKGIFAERILYLAVNEPIYKIRFLRDQSVMRMCEKMNVKFLVFNSNSKIIKEWKK